MVAKVGMARQLGTKPKGVRVCGWCAGAPSTAEGAAAHTRCIATQGPNRCECAANHHHPTDAVRAVQVRHTGMDAEECAEHDLGLTRKQADQVADLHALENGERRAAFTKVYVEAMPLDVLRKRLVEWCGATEKAARTASRAVAAKRITKVILDRKEERAMENMKRTTAKKAAGTKAKSTSNGDGSRGAGMPHAELIAWIKSNASKATSRGALFKLFRGAGNSANEKRFGRAVDEAAVTFANPTVAEKSKVAARTPKDAATGRPASAVAVEKAAAKRTTKAPAKKAAPKKAPAKRAPAKKSTAKKAPAKRHLASVK